MKYVKYVPYLVVHFGFCRAVLVVCFFVACCAVGAALRQADVIKSPKPMNELSFSLSVGFSWWIAFFNARVHSITAVV